ncbi:hypothetical protein RYX36_001793 [Vicia faba]
MGQLLPNSNEELRTTDEDAEISDLQLIYHVRDALLEVTDGRENYEELVGCLQPKRNLNSHEAAQLVTILKALAGVVSYIDSVHHGTLIFALERMSLWNLATTYKNYDATDIMDAFYRKQALKFLRVCLSSQLNLPGIVTDEGTTSKQLSTLLASTVDHSSRRSESIDVKADLGVKTKTQLMAEKSVFEILLMTIIVANGEPDLTDSADDFVVNICRHFAMIFHVDSSFSNVSAAAMGSSLFVHVGSRIKSSVPSNLKELDPLVFLDALVDVLADENRLHAKAALDALNVFSETLVFLDRSKHTDFIMSRGPGTPMIVSSPSMNPVYSPPPSVRVPVFEQLLPRLLHCCYGLKWQAQIGGVMGLGALVGKVTVETLCLFQVRIVRGLTYVLKKLPIYASKEQEKTSQVLTQVLRVVNNANVATLET